MAYTPNPYELSQPTTDKFVESAAAELRALKAALALITANVNYLGEWSTLTGAYSKGALLSHLGVSYLLVVDLADITLSEPSGVNPDYFTQQAALPLTGGTLTGPLIVPAGAVGSQVPRAEEVIAKVDGAARIPSWNTAGRPATPSGGDLGRNTDLSALEFSDGTVWNKLRMSGGTTATLTGASVDVTGIPTWAAWVAVDIFDGSATATTDMLVQLGTSSGIEATAYKTSAVYSGGSSTTSALTHSDGFIFRSVEASLVSSGGLEFKKVSGNKYAGRGMLGSNGSYLGYCSGGKELSGVLDRVRLLPRSGTFDSGTVSVTWGN